MKTGIIKHMARLSSITFAVCGITLSCHAMDQLPLRGNGENYEIYKLLQSYRSDDWAQLVAPSPAEFIKKFEGFSHTPYKCSGGKLTIGYGHVIKEGESLGYVTKAYAMKLLKHDIVIAEQAVDDLVTVKLNSAQHTAVVSLVYNIGVTAFADSTLLKLLNKRQFDAIPDEMEKWVHASGKKNEGLIRRREEEGTLFASR